MNRNLNRRIHPIAEADGLSPKKPRKQRVLIWKRLTRKQTKFKKTSARSYVDCKLT